MCRCKVEVDNSGDARGQRALHSVQRACFVPRKENVRYMPKEGVTGSPLRRQPRPMVGKPVDPVTIRVISCREVKVVEDCDPWGEVME